MVSSINGSLRFIKIFMDSDLSTMPLVPRPLPLLLVQSLLLLQWMDLEPLKHMLQEPFFNSFRYVVAGRYTVVGVG